MLRTDEAGRGSTDGSIVPSRTLRVSGLIAALLAVAVVLAPGVLHGPAFLAGVTLPGWAVVATFVAGGRELSYRFNVSSILNPLVLPALREFRCPSGI